MNTTCTRTECTAISGNECDCTREKYEQLIPQLAQDCGAMRAATPVYDTRLMNKKLALLICINDMPEEERHVIDSEIMNMLLIDPDLTDWLEDHPEALVD